MHVTIDYTPAIRQRAGIGRYTRNLVSALAQTDRENRYTLFCRGQGADVAGWPANFDVRTTPVSDRLLTAAWHKLRLPFPVERLSGKSDIFHSTDFTLPPLAAALGVATIHDLSFLRLGEHADPGLRDYLNARVPKTVAQAKRVLADSESTQRDLMELLGTPAGKISVVYAGVEERFQPVNDPKRLEQVRSRYQLPDQFVLFVGTIEPRKNLKRLISAYAKMRHETALPHKLIISGAKGWLYEGVFEQVRLEGLTGGVLFPGFVADEDLPALYTLASLFVFPSLYEGFGLPPLEAMACGTPVVASNNSSLPEVLGTAALFVDAHDTASIAQAMVRVLSDKSLSARLSRLGRAQATRFTWQAAAEQLMPACQLTMN